MKLTVEQTEKAKAFVQSKWRAPYPCNCCGHNKWNISNTLFQLIEFHHGNMVIGGEVAPVLPVICANCGNTVLVNAIVAGLVSNEPAKVTEGPK